MNAIATRFVNARLLLAVLAAIAIGTVSAAQAAVVSYSVVLSGPNESPANASPGIGTGQVDVDTAAHTMHVHVDFSGLVGTTTASHIHAPTVLPFAGTASVATTTPTFAGFPLGVTAGSYDNILNMTLASSYNPSYVAGNGGTTTSAELALAQAIADGKAYLNIHSTVVPGGEIRGFLTAIPVPAVSTTWGYIRNLYR